MARIFNAKVILEDLVLEEGWVSFEKGGISKMGQGTAPDGDDGLDAGNLYLAPGFIDLHVHGAMGYDFLGAPVDGLAAAANFHLSGGTTALCPTAATASYETFDAIIPRWREAQGLTQCRLLPLHLEGPHLAPGKAGAQDPGLMRPPTPRDIQWIQERAPAISQITIAPELPGALELIQRAAASGIVMSAGHSEATEEQMEKAVNAGLSKVTHLFNAMSVASKKGMFRQAGIVEYALAADNILCELVADSFHVRPTLTRMAYNAKGPNGIALVTDALAGAGMPLGYPFRLGRLECKVGEGFGMLADGSALAGSLARTIDLVRYMAKTVGLPLPEVIRMASLNPARALSKQKEFGSIDRNKAADFVLFDEEFVVRGVWVGGERVGGRVISD